MEIKPIKNWEELYEVSNTGEVFSCERKIKLKDCHKSGKEHTHLLKRKRLKGQKVEGYMRVVLCKDGQEIKAKVHRLVAEAFIQNTDNKLEINHKNGIRSDNRVENLEWCTAKENVNHAFKVLLRKRARGEEHGNVKLNSKQILEIRKLFKSNMYSKTFLAKSFDVSPANIRMIVTHKTWNHI